MRWTAAGWGLAGARGAGGLGLALALAGCAGQNKPPVETRAQLPTGEVSTVEPLVCLPAAADPDGDALSWRFAWAVDGAPYAGPLGRTHLPGDTVPPEHTRNGQRWTCTVTPLDGATAGPSA